VCGRSVDEREDPGLPTPVPEHGGAPSRPPPGLHPGGLPQPEDFYAAGRHHRLPAELWEELRPGHAAAEQTAGKGCPLPFLLFREDVIQYCTTSPADILCSNASRLL